jgi:arsenate reductase
MMNRLFWPFDDPAAFKGSEEETLDDFRRVRDQIKQKIVSWLETEGN